MGIKADLTNRQKIKLRIRKKVIGSPDKPRLVIFRSLKHIYAQLIDDVNNKTICSVSSMAKNVKTEKKEKVNKKDESKVIGIKLAKKALELNIKSVVFDRNGYLYHGRVKAVADGAREGGLKF